MSSKKRIILSGTVAAVIAIALMAGYAIIPALSSPSTTLPTTSSTLPASSSTATSSSQTTSSNGQTGVLGVQLTDPPTVPPSVSEVYMNYSAIEVHVAHAGNDTGWYPIAPAGEINLMSILNTSITLGSANVTTGVFNAIEFNITSVTVTTNVTGTEQNQTAILAGNHLIVPIVGGLQVNASENAGVLVDLSPTVLSVQNGTQTAYVFIPSARVMPIPDSVWAICAIRGCEIKNLQNQSWFTIGRGEISLTNATLTPDSLSVTITNTGKDATVVSSLQVYYPLLSLCKTYKCMTAVLKDNLPAAVPIADFAVLSNGTLYQFNLTASAVAHYQNTCNPMSLQAGVTVGYILAPGQSLTLTFNDTISTITPSILDYIHANVAVPQTLFNALSNIKAGSTYYMVATGPFGTFAYEPVNATSA